MPERCLPTANLSRRLGRYDTGLATFTGYRWRTASRDRSRSFPTEIYRHRDPDRLPVIGARARCRFDSHDRLRSMPAALFEFGPNQRLTGLCDLYFASAQSVWNLNA